MKKAAKRYGAAVHAAFTAVVFASALIIPALFYSHDMCGKAEIFDTDNTALCTAQLNERPCLVPCGTPFGIKILTDGVIVTGFGRVGDGDVFELSPAGAAGIEKGDIITRVNGVRVTSSDMLGALIANSTPPVDITYLRGDEEHRAAVYPKSDENGIKKIGLWVRDSTAGIGTMTFFDERGGIYGGLGHAVCDADTGTRLILQRGEIVPAQIVSVKKGADGIPGELCGNLRAGVTLGNIELNSPCGLFGRSSLCPVTRGALPMAYKNEVECGGAYIYTTVENAPSERYEIEIESIDINAEGNKNMVIRITDERLLEKTGGIVQGMSGSPIIQNGRLAGAVTHVYISDPTHGYAIFAQTMYETTAELYADRQLVPAA